MANTYTQIHIQAVFAVQNRQSLIALEWKNELYKYITGVVQNNGHKMLPINGMPDHIHLLFGLRPAQSLSDLIKYVKQDSSKWINNRQISNRKFSWQSGYGAFSYAKPQLPNIIRYIANQEQHHSKRSFQEEYIDLLKAHEIEFDDQYLFKPVV